MSLEINISTSRAVRESQNLVANLQKLGLTSEQAERKARSLDDRLRKKLSAQIASQGVDKLKHSLQMTRAEITRTQLAAGQLGAAFTTMGTGIRGMAANLVSMKSALMGLGLGLVARNIISTGASFSQTMAVVKGVSRATASEFEALEQQARLMGEQTEWSASQAADSLRFLSMAGFRANESVRALPGTLDLATAGNLDLGRAADIATNALTAMGLSVEDLTRVNDVFIGTITRTNTDMEMMAESFKYSAPLARAFGYDIETLSAMIGMLGNAGIQGSMAGTQLAMALQHTAKAAEELGMDSGATLLDVLEEIHKRGLSADEILSMFSQRAARAALVLKEVVPEVRSLAESLYAATGEAKTLADIMRNTVTGAFKALRSVIESVAIDIFKQYEEQIKSTTLNARQYIADHRQDILNTVDGLVEFSKQAATATKSSAEMFSTILKGWTSIPQWVRDIGILAALMGGRAGWAGVALFSYTVGEFTALGKAIILAEEGLVSWSTVFETATREGSAGLNKLWNKFKEDPTTAFLEDRRKKLQDLIADISTRKSWFGGPQAGDTEKLKEYTAELERVESKLAAIYSGKEARAWVKTESYRMELESVRWLENYYADVPLVMYEQHVTAYKQYLKAIDDAAKEHLSKYDAPYAHVKEYEQHLEAMEERHRVALSTIERFKKEAEEYDEALVAGYTADYDVVIGEAQVKEYQRAQEAIRKASEETFDVLKELTEHTASAMQQNFSDFFFSAMKGELKSLEDFATAIFDSILRAAADMMGQLLTQKLFGDAAPGGSGAGWFGTALSAFSALVGGGGGAGTGSPQPTTHAPYGVTVRSVHRGGVIGEDAMPKRIVPESIFEHAPRLHSGLRGDEFPAILQRGETVIPKDSKEKPINMNYNFTIAISAMDARSMSDSVARNPNIFLAPIKQALREGEIDLRNLLRSTR